MATRMSDTFPGQNNVQRMLLVRLATANSHFHLSTYFDSFAKLNTNLDRVNFVYRDLKKYNLFPTVVLGEKQDSRSQMYRAQGNEAFKNGDYGCALKYYTSSILTAKTDGILALAYANRSAIMFKMGRYHDCIVEIDRALASNYPDNLKSKLTTRRTKAEKLLNNSSKPFQPYHQEVPEIAASEKHPTIASASNCVKIESNEEFGRHVVAARDIEIGEILSVETPYACSLAKDVLVHCHACLEWCFNPIACDKCIYLLFCSEACKQKACDTFHKYECSVISTLLHSGLSMSDLVAIRVAILAREENSSEVDPDDIYRSDRCKEIKNLISGTVKYNTVDELHLRAITAAFVFHVFLNFTSIFNCENYDIVKKQFKENVLSYILVCDVNAFSICESVMGLLTWEDQRFAYGLYAFRSLFNHSCGPNVESIEYGSTTVLRSINSIKKGEQCFITYGPTYWNINRLDRYCSLKKRFFFECKCIACANNWNCENMSTPPLPLFFMLSDALREVDMITDIDDVANKHLPRFIQMLKRCEKLEPDGCVLEIKKIVFSCYKIFGNQRLV